MSKHSSTPYSHFRASEGLLRGFRGGGILLYHLSLIRWSSIFPLDKWATYFFANRLIVSPFFLLLVWLPNLQANSVSPPPSGDSPLKFDATGIPSDTYVVNDTDSPTLDRYLFRGESGESGGYDITIPINIRRYVGDVNTLLEKKQLADTFDFYIPAYDVDAATEPTFDCDADGIEDTLKPEVNEVYFNDELVGVLKGSNDAWKLNEVELDMRKLHFPTVPGGIGHNSISIKIDVANKHVVLSSGQVGCQAWATEIDWAAVQFAVTSPVVFVSGLSGMAGSFESAAYRENLAMKTGLPSEIITHTRFVPSLSACREATPSLTEHAAQMRESLKAMAERYGTDSVHLIAHSKGGLDSRLFLKELAEHPLSIQVGEMGGQPVLSDLVVPSLVTHGTPHQGTVIADMIVAHTGPVVFLVSDFCDLTTQVMQQVNPTLTIPRGITSLVIGADADKNRDGQIDDNEAADNQVQGVMATSLYQKLRDVASISVEHVPNPEDFHQTIPIVIEVPTITPQLNDTMVTVESAVSMPGVSEVEVFMGENGKNHRTVLDEEVQNVVINVGLTGALRWRFR